MNRRTAILSALAALLSLGHGSAQEDPGRAVIGQVHVIVYYATNGDLKAAGPKLSATTADQEKSLGAEKRLRFTHYGVLGQDTQPLLRSYESWAQPLKSSSEVLVRFEARSAPTEAMTGLDLELWLSRKKILKTDAQLRGNQPLFVLGPEWRGGRLIIGVSLAPKS
jgi:hypothetical protein